MEEVYNIVNWAKSLVIENPIQSVIILAFVIFLFVIMFDY